MANLSETPIWESVTQLETSDPVMGGESGVSNRAPGQLTHRTSWLKQEVEDLQENKAAKASTLQGYNISDAYRKDEVNVLITNAAPPGAVIFFAQSAAPTGWLKANGAAVSRTTYSKLFAIIGTVFGVGDGATTFNLPDLRGEFIRVWDDAKGIDSGRAMGSKQADALQSHNHYLPTGAGDTHSIPTSRYAIPDSTFANTTVNYNAASGTANTTYPNPNYTDPTVIGNIGTFTTETRPRNIALLACIKI